MTAPIVSIVVNVHNGERYLEECLDSIFGLQCQVPFEVIVADDGSTDRTAAIIDAYTDPRLVNIRLPTNVGAAAAINHAFAFVRGTYLARIDYDDRVHPDWMTVSLRALEDHPQAAFVCAGVQLIDADGRRGSISRPEDYGEAPGCRDRFRSLLTRHFVTAPTILARTSHWLRAIPVPREMNFCDWYMNLVMAESAPVVVLDRVTADYRVHPLGMHVTKVHDGMGERVTFEVLERFIEHSPRRVEIAPYERAIRALHYADWGNKYFGAGLNERALRCYRQALKLDPSLSWRGRFLHRLAGLLAGRGLYEKVKRLVLSLAKPV